MRNARTGANSIPANDRNKAELGGAGRSRLLRRRPSTLGPEFRFASGMSQRRSPRRLRAPIWLLSASACGSRWGLAGPPYERHRDAPLQERRLAIPLRPRPLLEAWLTPRSSLDQLRQRLARRR